MPVRKFERLFSGGMNTPRLDPVAISPTAVGAVPLKRDNLPTGGQELTTRAAGVPHSAVPSTDAHTARAAARHRDVAPATSVATRTRTVESTGTYSTGTGVLGSSTVP